MLELILNIMVLFAIGGTGWLIFSRLNLPAAGVLGSLTLVLLAGYLGYRPEPLPEGFIPALLVLLGIHIGSMVNRESVKEFRKILLPGAIVAAWSIAFTLIFGYLLSLITDFDLTTAVLSSTPGGGVVEVGAISVAVNADVAAVTFLHFFRLLFVMLVFPLIVKAQNLSRGKIKTGFPFFANSPDNGREKPEAFPPDGEPGVPARLLSGWLKPIFTGFKELFRLNLLILMAVALTGGLLACFAGVPAGWMIGSMIAVGIFSLVSSREYKLPEPILNLVFVGFGIFVAQLINFYGARDVETMYAGSIQSLLKAGLLLSGALLLSAVLVALFIKKVTGWDFNTCLLSVAPGGLTAMTALAVELEGDPLKVSILHVLRLIIVKISLPVIILFI